MFFIPTLKSDWFYAHKASQCLMIVLMVAMLVMPILHQPQKAEAEPVSGTVVIFITIAIAGAAVFVNWWVNQPNPCPVGCGSVVDTIEAHHGECGNCDTIVYKCLDTRPAVSENPAYPEHKARCDACDQWYYLCDDPDVHTEEEEDRYQHSEVDSDCGIHKHNACKPEDNHQLNMITADCGIHSYLECNPVSNHQLKVFPFCGHNIYECTEGHEGVFCSNCLSYDYICENHECPPDDSSGCCDDSSGCCDDGS